MNDPLSNNHDLQLLYVFANCHRPFAANFDYLHSIGFPLMEPNSNAVASLDSDLRCLPHPNHRYGSVLRVVIASVGAKKTK